MENLAPYMQKSLHHKERTLSNMRNKLLASTALGLFCLFSTEASSAVVQTVQVNITNGVLTARATFDVTPPNTQELLLHIDPTVDGEVNWNHSPEDFRISCTSKCTDNKMTLEGPGFTPLAEFDRHIDGTNLSYTIANEIFEGIETFAYHVLVRDRSFVNKEDNRWARDREGNILHDFNLGQGDWVLSLDHQNPAPVPIPGAIYLFGSAIFILLSRKFLKESRL